MAELASLKGPAKVGVAMAISCVMVLGSLALRLVIRSSGDSAQAAEVVAEADPVELPAPEPDGEDLDSAVPEPEEAVAVAEPAPVRTRAAPKAAEPEPEPEPETETAAAEPAPVATANLRVDIDGRKKKVRSAVVLIDDQPAGRVPVNETVTVGTHAVTWWIDDERLTCTVSVPSGGRSVAVTLPNPRCP